MAKKAEPDSLAHRGRNDIVGIVLLCFALLLLISLLSYDPHDLAQNRVPPNHTAHNWIGPIGAHLA